MNWIQKVIELSGLSLNEFGWRISVSGQTVSKWNRGVCEPDYISQKKIRKVFKELESVIK